jgi:N-methylhydantoinase A
VTARLAVDIGGTFVDAIAFDRETGALSVEKVSTTPSAPTEGVLAAVRALDVDVGAVDAFVHGTTLGLNAFIERDGARTGIVTNRGFEDVYEIGRTDLERDAMYDVTYEPPETLVPRRRRIGVPGRLAADGSVVEPLDEEAVRAAADALRDDHDVDAVAICLLHAYRNPAHERRAAEIVRERCPDVAVSISSDISQEYREYERTATTVLDAYIKPVFGSYVDELDRRLREEGFDGAFFVTRSGGGALTAASAERSPVHTILSGPAGGLIGASAVAERTGRRRLVAVDVGGTSLDACVVDGGSPTVAYESSLEHLPLLLPIYDVRTIGSGGGSIARVDGELLRVGPESAGADPGPICYGRGGEDPTVTDAALVLGYLDPDGLLGGELSLDVASTREGLRDRIADPLDVDLEGAARGVLDVAVARTESAIREITVERGLDLREFAMLAYGGAGPMLVPTVAARMDVPEVLVPQAPSVFSAWGMVMTDVVTDAARTWITVLDGVTIADLDARFEELEATAAEELADEGFGPDRRQFERRVDCRYLGQEHTVGVPAADLSSVDELVRRFERGHDAQYGHTMDDPPQLVHLRVRARGLTDDPPIGRAGDADAGPDAAPEPEPDGSREAFCFERTERVPFAIYDRDGLAAGVTIDGPAIVREPTTSVVFHSNQTATVDEFGHLVIREGSA